LLLVQYEKLRTMATSMKEQYEVRMEELEGQQETLQEQLQAARSETKSVAVTTTGAAGGQKLLDEVIINTCLSTLKGFSLTFGR